MEGEGGRGKGGKGQVQRVQNGLPINSVVIGAEISRLNEKGKKNQKKTKKKKTKKKKKHEILARLHSRAVTESTNERIYRKVGWLMFSLECRF